MDKGTRRHRNMRTRGALGEEDKRDKILTVEGANGAKGKRD